MQLLYDREQVSGARAPKFKLMAKIELDEQERALVAHYRFDKAMLINEFDPELIKKTAMLAVAAFVVAFVVFITAIIGWKTGLFLALSLPAAAVGITLIRTANSSSSATC